MNKKSGHTKRFLFILKRINDLNFFKIEKIINQESRHLALWFVLSFLDLLTLSYISWLFDVTFLALFGSNVSNLGNKWCPLIIRVYPLRKIVVFF